MNKPHSTQVEYLSQLPMMEVEGSLEWGLSEAARPAPYDPFIVQPFVVISDLAFIYRFHPP